MGNVWTKIPFIAPSAKERVGYSTQKPLKLLERIIKASYPEGGLVLDPFCGCATACHNKKRPSYKGRPKAFKGYKAYPLWPSKRLLQWLQGSFPV